MNGNIIGIIGYLTPDTKFLAPTTKVEYEDEVVAIRREVSKLKDEGVNIIIALGHSGYLKDLEIARQVEDLDLVIGGHSNTFLWNEPSTVEKPEHPQGWYPTLVTQPSGRIVPVVQAYAYTKYMGRLHLIFDPNGEIIDHSGTPLLLNQKIPRDPEVKELVEKYSKSINKINNEVVGSSFVYLNGEECRLRECNIGNMINDAILYYTNQIYPEVINIAVTQGGRIRASIYRRDKPPFILTKGDWITVLPFSDVLTVITVNGTTLREALEHSVDSWRTIDSTGQFLQISGIKVTYDLAKPPGSRIVEALAICSNCKIPKQEEIQDRYEYKIITSTFLADGGDGYSMFKPLPRNSLQYNEVTPVIEYLKTFSPVRPAVSERITILNEDKVQSIPSFINKDKKRGNRQLLSSTTNLKFNYLNIILSIFLMMCHLHLQM